MKLYNKKLSNTILKKIEQIKQDKKNVPKDITVIFGLQGSGKTTLYGKKSVNLLEAVHRSLIYHPSIGIYIIS